jgi:hypothetical protein
MSITKKSVFLLVVQFLFLTGIKCQTTINSTGNNSSGSGGSISYSVGQITFNTFSGIEGASFAQGVQQPYEISVVTSTEDIEGILLNYKIYPNPTNDKLILIIKPLEGVMFNYQLYNQFGILIQIRNIESEETEISLEGYSASIYFLKVIRNNMEVKVFKIIKNK